MDQATRRTSEREMAERQGSELEDALRARRRAQEEAAAALRARERADAAEQVARQECERGRQAADVEREGRDPRASDIVDVDQELGDVYQAFQVAQGISQPDDGGAALSGLAERLAKHPELAEVIDSVQAVAAAGRLARLEELSSKIEANRQRQQAQAEDAWEGPGSTRAGRMRYA